MFKKWLSLLLALSLTVACLPMAAYAAGSTTAMRDGADGLPAGSVLRFPNDATKWRVLNGSKANNGEDGIFVLSETASTEQVNLRQAYESSPTKTYCGELYTKLFSPTFETVIKKTTIEKDSLYIIDTVTYPSLYYVLKDDRLFALSAEEADIYKNIIPVIDSKWGLRTYKEPSGVKYYAYITTAGECANKSSFASGTSFEVSVRPAFNLEKSKVMLFIPTSISGVSGTLSAVPASANEYRPLIAQDNRAGFTAQTLQTDGKTLTVSYANAAAATSGEYISAAVKSSSGAYTYYGKVKAATDASGTVTVTLPDSINPAADTLYIFNEQHSTASDAKTGLSSNMQKVCITHSFEVSDQGATNEHILNCSACGYQTSEAHDFAYVSDDNDATHTGTCRVCQKTVSGTHSLSIIGYDPGVHTKRCDICSYITNVPHNLIYTDNGNGTHTGACECGYALDPDAHQYEYAPNAGSNTHMGKCVCGNTIKSEAHNIATVYDENEHKSFCTKCDTVICLAKHTLSYSNNGDGTHKASCDYSACGYTFTEEHDFQLAGRYTDTHEKMCKDCYYTFQEPHDIHYTYEDNTTHMAECSFCDFWNTEEHTFTYTDNGDGTHTRACTLCSNSTVSAHSFAYVDRGDGVSEYVCGDCGAAPGIFSYNRSVIPDGCRDITKLVAKDSVATSVSTWGDGRVDYLFDDFFNKFGGWGNNIGGTTTVLPATFELTKSAAVRGIAVWTGSDTRSYGNRNPDTVRLYAKDSTDGDFEKVAEISTANLPAENYKPYTYTFPTTAKPYKYFKVEFQNSRGAYEGTQVGELKLLGTAQTPVEFDTENIGRAGEDGTVAGENFTCTLYAHGGHPAADKVEVLADGVNFTDYSYDAATGVLKIDGAKVTDASYTIRAAGEKFTATVTPNVGRLRFTGDKTAQIGTDYTAKLADSKGGTSTLPEYIAVLIDGDMLDEEFFSYDKKTGDITINGAVITGDIRISAFEMYKLAVLDEQVTEHRTSGTVTAEGCTGSWSFDADSYTLRLEGFNGSFVCRETATSIVRYSGKENLTLVLSDCSITTDYTMFSFDNWDLVITSADGEDEEKSTADITVRLTGSNTLSTDDYVFYGQNITVQTDGTTSISAAVAVNFSGMNIIGKGSLILDCLNTMAVQGMIYYGANKPTKSAFYQQSHLEYKNGVLTPGGLDLDIDGDLFVRNGKLNTELFDDPDVAPFDYKEVPFSYKDGVLTFRDGTVISEITFTAIGDVKYAFEGAAELSSEYSTVFNQVYGSASFEAADGADVTIKSDQESAIRAYSAVSFSGSGKITAEAPSHYDAVHADAVICGGELTDVSGKAKAVYDGSAERRISTYSPLSSIVIYFNDDSTASVLDSSSASLPDGIAYDADTSTLTLSSTNIKYVNIVGDVNVVLDGAAFKTLTCNGNLALTLKNDSSACNIIADTLTVNAENGTLSLSYEENVLLLVGDLIVDGEVFKSCNGTKCYISNRSAVFGNDTTCIYLDGTYFTPSENGSYYAYDKDIGWLNTKNTDTAPLYAQKIRKTIGNTTATSIMLTMKNADIAGKNDESVIFCDGDLDIVLVGENKITPVSAIPTPSLAPTSMRAQENTADDGDGLSTYGMPICAQGSLTISGTGSLTVGTSEKYRFSSGIYSRLNMELSGIDLSVTSDAETLFSGAGSISIKDGSRVYANAVSKSAILARDNIAISDSDVTASAEELAILTDDGNIYLCNSNVNVPNSTAGVYSKRNLYFDGCNADINSTDMAVYAANNIALLGGAYIAAGTDPDFSTAVRVYEQNTIGYAFNEYQAASATRVVIKSDGDTGDAYVTAVAEDGTARITASIGSEKSGTLAVAGYLGGRLAAIKTLPLGGSINTTAAELGIAPGSVDEIKVMLWRSIPSMYPLCSPARVSLAPGVSLSDADGVLMLSACSGGRECTLIAAGYSGGRLDGAKSLPLGAQSPNISAAVSELCPELAGSEKLKAMLWDGFMPIAPNAEN